MESPVMKSSFTMRKIPVVLSLLGLTASTLLACQSLPQNSPQRQQVASFQAGGSRAPIQLDTALGEVMAPNEAALTAEIETSILKGMQKQQGSYPMTRDVHAKHHGCVKSFVSVDNSALPAPLRVGVFAQNKTYPSWIRFSNGQGVPKADADGDVRGFGLKLMGVPGPKLLENERNEQTQDFLLINTPDFFIDDLRTYAKFIDATSKGGIGIAGFAITHPGVMYKIYKIFSQKMANPLEQDFFSTTPYKLGNTVVKYRVKPCRTGLTPYPASPTPNFLRENMSRSLAQSESCFTFMVQLQKDPRQMPLEDATVHWDEKLSPWIPVAQVNIPAQRFDSEAQMGYCENMSYTPWHSLPEHKPLGAPNRVRKSVYEMVSQFRHHHNNAPRREPTGHDIQAAALRR